MRLSVPTRWVLLYGAIALLVQAIATYWRWMPDHLAHLLLPALALAAAPGYLLGGYLWHWGTGARLIDPTAVEAGLTLGLWLNATALGCGWHWWRGRRQPRSAI